VYAPWCGDCKKLEPEYNRLGEVLRNIPSIVISKMDGTKNEHALVQVSLFFAFLSLVLGLLDAHKAITSPMALNLFLVILSGSRIGLGNFWDSRYLVTTMPSYPSLYMPCFDTLQQLFPASLMLYVINMTYFSIKPLPILTKSYH
jgi:thiol-disulfide isomerase/thioredoxin